MGATPIYHVSPSTQNVSAHLNREPLTCIGSTLAAAAVAAAVHVQVAPLRQRVADLERSNGKAVQVDPIKPKLTALGSQPLKLRYRTPHSSSAYKIQRAPLHNGRHRQQLNQADARFEEFEHKLATSREKIRR